MTFFARRIAPLIALSLLLTLAPQAEAVPCPTCPPGYTCDPNDGQCKPLCNPWCEDQNRECGPDGCGGSCGWCIDPTPFCNDGVCVDAESCIPNCKTVTDEGLVNKQCGSDGCGGECGLCLGIYVCDEFNFVCVECGSPAFPCPDPATTPDPDTPCTPACQGVECGPDGCGGTCGECAIGLTCSHGICNTCTPTCFEEGGVCQTDAQCEAGALCNAATGFCRKPYLCGGDGCGGSCGTCNPGFSCVTNMCVEQGECAPQCSGRACGPDSCGGSCGTCPSGTVCDADGLCLTASGNDAEWSEACPEGQAYNALAGACVSEDNEASTTLVPGEIAPEDEEEVRGACHSSPSSPGLLMLMLGALAMLWRRRRA